MPYSYDPVLAIATQLNYKYFPYHLKLLWDQAA